ncbi:MAG: hypothetical protein HYS80_00890 [Candidatus Aenigmarchaeota archaeon]|nr:hypothetical protein [Candidatus Aenigmarchaeota archaeon]
MLYDIDAFGFVGGYISKNWNVMSEQDLLVDKYLGRRLKEAKYQVWRRHNILELKTTYEKFNPEHKNDFERFCREMFERI